MNFFAYLRNLFKQAALGGVADAMAELKNMQVHQDEQAQNELQAYVAPQLPPPTKGRRPQNRE